MYRISKNNNFSRQISPRNSTLDTADKSTQEVVSTSRLECRRARASDHQGVPHARTRAPDKANSTDWKVFGRWEQGTFRAPWSSFDVLTAEKVNHFLPRPLKALFGYYEEKYQGRKSQGELCVG